MLLARTATYAPQSILTKSRLDSLTSEKNSRYNRTRNVNALAIDMMNRAQKLRSFLFSKALPPPPSSDLCTFILHCNSGVVLLFFMVVSDQNVTTFCDSQCSLWSIYSTSNRTLMSVILFHPMLVYLHSSYMGRLLLVVLLVLPKYKFLHLTSKMQKVLGE